MDYIDYMRSVYSLVCFSMLVSMCIATTPMTIVNSDPDYQTGQFLAIKLPAEYAGTTISYYNTGYGSNMATASLNATLGIMSNSFSLQGGILGWNITVSSLTATGITIGATAVNSNNKITYLRVCWMVSNHSLLNLNYFSYTLGTR